MASYVELFDFLSVSKLKNIVQVCVWSKATELLKSETPTQAQIDWAVEAIKSPKSHAEYLVRYVLADNSSLTKTQIQAAIDNADSSTIQNKVSAAIDVIIAGGS